MKGEGFLTSIDGPCTMNLALWLNLLLSINEKQHMSECVELNY